MQKEKYLSLKSWQCGGSIISEDVILTAAHCVGNAKNVAEIVVQMGHSNAEEGAFFKVKSVLIHPDYNPFNTSQLNDIALLRVNESLVFNNSVQPIGKSKLYLKISRLGGACL